MPQHKDLTDAQWEMLRRLIPEPERREDGRGRPWKGSREVLNGILYVLQSGDAWADLPEHYPPYQTCHRRFQQWLRSGVMQDVLEALDEDRRVMRGRSQHELSATGRPRLDPWSGISALKQMSDRENLPAKPIPSATILLERRSRR